LFIPLFCRYFKKLIKIPLANTIQVLFCRITEAQRIEKF
jgi:hypothetical protein